MSNQQPQHQQQQKQQQPAPEWKPAPGTIFLVQTDQEFAPRARKYVARKWPALVDPATGESKPWIVETELNPLWLKQTNAIVVLYSNPAKGIFDEATGKWRERNPARKTEAGRTIAKAEPTQVLYTKPIDMQPFWRAEGYGEGVDRKALCAEISKRVHPCRAQLDERTPAPGSRDPQYSISVRAV